jgi:hypothetical protein
MMRAKAERRLQKKMEKENAAQILRAERIKKKEYEERRKVKDAEEALKREILIKTHKFFRIKKVGTGYSKVPTGVVYFGDATLVNDAWIPHGQGEYKVAGEVFYSGDFFQGKMHGHGVYLFANMDVWTGTFRFDELHGVGILQQHPPEGVDDPEPRECIYHKNRKICFTDELQVGVHIKLPVPIKHNRGATILGDTPKRGHFRVKLDDGGVQNLNLAEVAFSLDTAAARVTLLEDYVSKAGELGATENGTFAEQRYDYKKDVYEPTYTDHDENWYSEKPIPVDDKAAAEVARKKKEAWEARQKAKEDIKKEAEKNQEMDKAKEEKKAAEEEAKREAQMYQEGLDEAKAELLAKREEQEQEKLRRREAGKEGGGG